MKASITLDIAYDEDTPDEAIEELTRDTSASAVLVNEHGPAGGADLKSGWPEFAFTGPMKDVVEVVRRYCGDDAEQALFLCEAIELSE